MPNDTGSGVPVFVPFDFCEAGLEFLGGARRYLLSLRYWSTSMTLRSGGWKVAEDEGVIDDCVFGRERLGLSACEVTERNESCDDLGEFEATRDDSISSIVCVLQIENEYFVKQ